MRKILFSLAIVICVVACASFAWGQGPLDQRISELSQKISDGLSENQKRTIAVVEFADLRGNVTDFGRFIAEDLITHLHVTKKFKVIERHLLNKVIAEQRLSLGGMIDQSSARKLGQLLGVEAIASGTITDLGKSLRVNARLIDTRTGEIFSVAAIEIVKDDSVMALMGAGATGPIGTSGNSTNNPVPNAVASKDIGPLRVVLKSVMRVKLTDNFGSSNAIRCSFEFINLDTQRPIAVAMNATTGTSATIGNYLRSTLADEKGGIWRLRNSEVSGMSIVGVGVQYWGGPLYDPAEIVTVLSKRDELGTDVGTDRQLQYRFVFGTTTEMSPGQRLAVTMNYVENVNQTTSPAPPKIFELASEIVVGLMTNGTKKTYTLYNLTFDRVSLPTRGA